MVKNILFYTGLVAIFAGLTLAFVSWLEVCTDMCAGTHNYRLFGMNFKTFGLIFFPALLATHSLAYRFKFFQVITSLLIAGALGSELVFIWIQKFEIKAWCPVCLGIAGALTLAGLTYLASYLIQLKRSIDLTQKEEIMNSVKKGFSTLTVFTLGLIVALVGVTKINPLEAMQESVKESIVFGRHSSPIEIYIFTDWQCPACRKLETNLSSILPVAKREAKVVFVDVDIHPETLNFVPYNLSFMMHNKDKYLQIRDVLTEISKSTGSPSENEIESAIAPLHVKYEQLNFADVAVGMKYFKHLANEFDVNSTPTMVLINRDTKKGKKLYGYKEITRENVEKAIASLKT